MRHLLLAVALVAVVTLNGTADDPKPKKVVPIKSDPSKKSEPTLKVGDPAPAIKASKWLQGDEVTKFEKDKIYVVEFWATWCGPCIVIMPHMAELQAEYRNKGVTFIGFTAKDPNNSEEKVVEFVKKRGPKLGYTFAYADDRETNTAWMTASGQRGIPCSFVVDRDSRIAYIGHPMFLDVVLPKVVEGTWKGKASADEIAQIQKEYSAMATALRSRNPEEAFEAMTAFDKKYPELSQIPYTTASKLGVLFKAGKTNEAKQFATSLVKKAEKYEDVLALRSVSLALSQNAKHDKEMMSLAVKAAEAVVTASGDKDAMALINLANVYFAAGEKDKAREYGKKAVEAAAATPGRLKDVIEAQAKKFDE